MVPKASKPRQLFILGSSMQNSGSKTAEDPYHTDGVLRRIFKSKDLSVTRVEVSLLIYLF